MPKISEFMVDTEKMKKGTWVDWEPFAGIKARLLIGSSNNPEYEKEVRKLYRENVKQLREDPSSEQEILKPAVAKYLLLGWEGFIDEKTNKSIPYSYETSLSLLKTPGLFHLCPRVLAEALTVANFRREILRESEKN